MRESGLSGCSGRPPSWSRICFSMRAGAGEGPTGLGHLFDEEVLVGGGGLELGAVLIEEGVEFGRILVGEDGERAGESVLARVLGDRCFSRGGAWSGALFRVLLIGPCAG